MRIEPIVVAIKQRRLAMQERIMSSALSHEDFLKQQGVWQGLGDALRIVEDAVKEALKNED